jgi:hypothetical protein
VLCVLPGGINPDVAIESYTMNITTVDGFDQFKASVTDADSGRSRVDLILSCVDNYEARITINQVSILDVIWCATCLICAALQDLAQELQRGQSQLCRVCAQWMQVTEVDACCALLLMRCVCVLVGVFGYQPASQHGHTSNACHLLACWELLMHEAGIGAAAFPCLQLASSLGAP